MTRLSPTEVLARLNKWLAENPPRERPYDTATEERMAHVANGGTVRALLTDPAVRGGRRERRDGDWVSRDGQTWAYEPYSGEAS